jgi:hypothetical protein
MLIYNFFSEGPTSKRSAICHILRGTFCILNKRNCHVEHEGIYRV